MTASSVPSELDIRLDDALAALPIIAILRSRETQHLVAAAQVLAEEGIGAIEFPLSSPGTFDVISEARKTLDDSVLVGAGTVLDEDDAHRAIDAGAQLIVSPALCLPAVRFARATGVPAIPGIFTASEALEALAAGARIVKLFPAVVAGPRYLAALRDPFPDLRAVPTGGVRREDVDAWLQAGVAALGLGSPLHGDALRTGDMAGLRAAAKDWVGAVRAGTA